MSTFLTTQTDTDVQTAVQEELDWTPDVDAAGIGVAVEDSTVTLSGEVDSFAERIAAVNAAKRVRGVKAVVDALRVHPAATGPATDVDVAKEVEHALGNAANVPQSVSATIRDHDIVLTGEVNWDFERQAAQRAVQFLRGVNSVDNRITIKARPSAADTKDRITGALRRQAVLDAQGIKVLVVGDTVTLTGTVHSFAEKSQAGRAAWASPHVNRVDNELRIVS